MEKVVTLDQFLGDQKNDMGCAWEKFVKLRNAVQGYACEKCEEPSNKCPFYLPVCELNEYLAVN